MKAKITVITVVRNDENHIEGTILSVLNQTYEDIEYIVIDGKSTDGTWEKILKYKDRLFYTLSESDKGIYDAMNKGVRVATGEWIIFMNSGDSFYNKDVVLNIFNHFEDNGELLLYGDVCITNSSNKGTYIKKARAEVSSKVEVAPSFHQAIFTRSVELKTHPFEIKYKIIADYAFFFDLYYRNPSRKYTDIVVCNYDNNGISATSRKGIVREKALFFYYHHKYYRFIIYLFIYIKRLVTG